MDEILIEGELSKVISEIKLGQLSETEMMGMEFGSGGSLVLVEYGLSRLMDIFDSTSKADKKMREQLQRLYSITQLTKDSFLLRLKQLDY